MKNFNLKLPPLSSQIFALYKKNLLINVRNKVDIPREFIFPLFISLIILFQKNTEFFTDYVLPYFLPLILLGLLRKIITDVVNDKQLKFKETLKIIGLRETSYVISWILTYYTIGIFIEFVMLLLLVLTDILNQNAAGYIIIAFLLYLGASVSLMMFITVFFNDQRQAIKLGSGILSLLGLIYFLVTYTDPAEGWYYVAGVVPQTNFALAIMSKQENHRLEQEFSFWGLCGVQLFNIGLYFGLYLYFSQIVRAEYGISRRILQFKKKGINKEEEESVFSASDKVLEIINLTKKFGGLKAVDELNLQLKKKEIFCLLGHNGAGKTTTISLLTGLIQANEGDIQYFGYDFYSAVEQIRLKFGYCPQQNILYDFLTVQEHFELICRLKGFSQTESHLKIARVVSLLQIEEHQNKYCKNLSFGSKRKLQFGLGILGDGQIIFLDEPTSGMDPVSRRLVWDILKDLRNQGKTVILTTHQLDEAEYLADQIAILSDGKLLELGDCEKIKKAFGEGYLLTISSKLANGNPQINFVQCKNQILEIVARFVPIQQATLGQINEEFIKLVLPFNYYDRFSFLFQELEKYSEKLILSLEMNSLEESFVNIGKQEENKRFKPNYAENQVFAEEKENIFPLFEIERKNLLLKQISATIIKRFLMLTQDFNASLMLYIFHFFYLLFATLFSKFYILEQDFKEYSLISGSIRLILGGYVMLSPLYLSFHVQERELQIKHILKIIGQKLLSYWIGNFVFDFCLFLLHFAAITILSFSLSLEFFTKNFGQIALLFLFFGPTLIVFTYLLSFIFKTYHGASHIYPVLFILSYAIPYLLVYIFTDYIYEDSPELSEAKVYKVEHALEGIFLLVSPIYVFERGLSIHSVKGNPHGFIYITEQIGLFVVIFILQIITYSAVIIFIENYYRIKKHKIQYESHENTEIQSQNNIIANQLIDGSVQNEIQVLLENQNSIGIRVESLRKSYNKVEALKGVSFYAPTSNVFGLLGPNGAGKSTIFNILSSFISEYSGKIFLNNHLLKFNEHQNIYQRISMGICTQYDTLWDHLTFKQHLQIYGKLKGLDSQQICDFVQFFSRELHIAKYFNVKTKFLSGGNKRKLSVCLAIIGNNDIIFFDEPTTGIDPYSKRLVWALLKKSLIACQSSVILTTHSMNEAEFLSNKIAILINGELYCINSLQSLKSTYSEGYKIFVKPSAEKNENSIKESVQKIFAESVQIASENNDYLAFQLPISFMKFSEIFNILDNIIKKEQKLISDFAISSNTLEQIFINLVNQVCTSKE